MRNYLKEASKYRWFSTAKFLLIGKIKGLSEQSKLITKHQYKALSVDKANQIACHKFPISQDIRNHLLTYAFLRGKAYGLMEKKYFNSGAPSPHTILKIIYTHLPYLEGKHYNVNIDNINAWIRGEV